MKIVAFLLSLLWASVALAQPVAMPPNGGPSSGGGCPGSTNFAQDNFNGGDGTALDGRTDTLGNTWSKAGTGGGLLQNAQSPGGVGVSALSDLEASIDSGAPPCANYTVTATIHGRTAGGLVGPICRGSSGGNFYIAYANTGAAGGAGDYEIAKFISGSSTVLSTNATGVTDGDVIALTCNGSTISMKLNGGSTLISVTDSSITAAGKAGVAVIDAIAGRNALYDSVFSAK